MSKFNQQLGQKYKTPIHRLSSIGQVNSNGNHIVKVCQPLSLVNNDLQNGYKSRMKSSLMQITLHCSFSTKTSRHAIFFKVIFASSNVEFATSIVLSL
jgi:hypothetical protein